MTKVINLKEVKENKDKQEVKKWASNIARCLRQGQINEGMPDTHELPADMWAWTKDGLTVEGDYTETYEGFLTLIEDGRIQMEADLYILKIVVETAYRTRSEKTFILVEDEEFLEWVETHCTKELYSYVKSWSDYLKHKWSLPQSVRSTITPPQELKDLSNKREKAFNFKGESNDISKRKWKKLIEGFIYREDDFWDLEDDEDD